MTMSLRSLDALVDLPRVAEVNDEVAIRTGDERGNLYPVKTLQRVSFQAGAQLPLPAQIDAGLLGEPPPFLLHHRSAFAS